MPNGYFAVFYLSPGDFHDFAAFNKMETNEIRLINGDFLPVNQFFMTHVEGDLALNERVVLNGTFHGR